eukprot:5666670-Prymnesium_polylepis.1
MSVPGRTSSYASEWNGTRPHDMCSLCGFASRSTLMALSSARMATVAATLWHGLMSTALPLVQPLLCRRTTRPCMSTYLCWPFVLITPAELPHTRMMRRWLLSACRARLLARDDADRVLGLDGRGRLAADPELPAEAVASELPAAATGAACAPASELRAVARASLEEIAASSGARSSGWSVSPSNWAPRHRPSSVGVMLAMLSKSSLSAAEVCKQYRTPWRCIPRLPELKSSLEWKVRWTAQYM